MSRVPFPVDPAAALGAFQDTLAHPPGQARAAGPTLFEALLRELPQPAMLQSVDGTVLAVSGAMCELTG